jgi:proliferating cell nuclear antigen PCNA
MSNKINKTTKRNNTSSSTDETEQKTKRITKKAKAAMTADGHFHGEFADADIFKKIIEAIKDFSDVTDLQCSKDGIDSQFMDASHVTLTLLHLDRRDFEVYEYSRDITIGVKFDVMINRLAFSKNLGSSQLIIDALPNADKYSLTLTSKENPERRLVSEMHQLHVDMEHMGIPEEIHEWEIDMSTMDYGIFVTAYKINDTVDLVVSEEMLLISATNTDGQPIVFHLPATKVEAEISVKEETIDDNDDEEEPCDADGADEESEQEEEAKPKARKSRAKKQVKKKEPKVIKAGSGQELYIKHNTVGICNGPATDKLKARFALRYMSMYAKATEVSSNGRVKLIIDAGRPILIKVDVLTHSTLQFYLAPKIDDSEVL